MGLFKKKKKIRTPETEMAESKICMTTGAGLGVYSIFFKLGLGYFCPACMVAVPGFFGYGFFKRWKAKKMKKEQEIAKPEGALEPHLEQ